MICKTKINKQDIKCIDDINEFYECENYGRVRTIKI